MFEGLSKKMNGMFQGAIQGWRSPDSLRKPVGSASAYSLRGAYYYSEVFSPDRESWGAILVDKGLYQHTRLIFNPVPNVVKFYEDNIWSQANNPKYPKLVAPVVDAEESLMLALAQIDQWTQWRAEQQRIKRYAAALGGVLVEVIDDDVRQKVTQKTIHPECVIEMDRNDSGDVQSYTIEYSAWDAALKETYTFKKIVDKEKYQYFKNGNPFDYTGAGSTIYHNFGFCPAAWFQHRDDGLPAFTDFTKVNHVNSLASHLHDNIHKEIESAKIVFSEDPDSVKVLSGATQNKDGSYRETDSRLDKVVIAMKNGNVGDLSGTLKLAESHPFLKDLLLSFGDDYPELEYRQIIKENGNLSGTALERLLTPAQNKLDAAAPNYDGQFIKLRQMQIAIAGWRTKNGWRNLTDQQRLFAPFNLDSYDRGLLDFNLKPSRLIELSEEEIIDLQSKKLDNANKAQGIYPLKERIKMTGISDEKEVDRFFNELSSEAGLQANENQI